MILVQISTFLRRWHHILMQRLGALSPAFLLVLLTAVVVSIGLLLVQSTMAQRAARSLALSEADSQIALEAVRQSLVDAETGQRGYLLTLDSTYLAPYNAARNKLPDELLTLKTYFDGTGDANDRERMAKIESLAKAKMNELDGTVQYVRAGDGTIALDLVRTDGGKRVMDNLRTELAALSEAQRQRRVVAFEAARAAEGRVVPLLLAMWLTLVLLIWAGFRGERSRALAAAEAEQTARLRALNARNELLARELDHRVKNLFGVVLSLIGLARRRTGSTVEVVDDISQRVHALARAHTVAVSGAATGDTALGALLESLCEAYADAAGARVALSGPDCTVPANAVTPLALLIHELATNATKYGALSVPEGKISISWTKPQDGSALLLNWRETGGPAPHGQEMMNQPAGSGFGTRMSLAAVRQLGGTLEREWPASGAVVRLSVPQLAAIPEPPDQRP